LTKDEGMDFKKINDSKFLYKFKFQFIDKEMGFRNIYSNKYNVIANNFNEALDKVVFREGDSEVLDIKSVTKEYLNNFEN